MRPHRDINPGGADACHVMESAGINRHGGGKLGIPALRTLREAQPQTTADTRIEPARRTRDLC
jgi:hypothetical protein